MPLDEANDYFADPSAVAVDAAGHRAFVASGGADVVTMVDLDRLAAWVRKATAAERQEAIYDLSLSAEYVVGRIPTGRNPRHLVLSPDGTTLLVAERLEDSILVVDANRLVPLGRIVLGDGGTDDPIRRGERMFTTAAYTFQHQFSCRSCHPDGHVDGLSYDFDGDGIGDNLLGQPQSPRASPARDRSSGMGRTPRWKSNAAPGSPRCSCARNHFPRSNCAT